MACFRIIIALGLGIAAFFEVEGQGQWKIRTADSSKDLPPVPSIADSPVAFLTRLLEATDEERAQTLLQKSDSGRAFWKRKLREYEAMPQALREARLRTAQLHWYLALLIHSSKEARGVRLSQIPEGDRLLVKHRMEQWDALPEDLRTDILANIRVMQYFARLVSSSPEQRAALLKTSSENPMNEAGSSWKSLSPKRRQAMFDAYASFFKLPKIKQEAAIAKIPFPVRKQFKERWDELLKMPPNQRQRCIEAIALYAKMTNEERRLFRGNAERWRTMDEAERRFWTRLRKATSPVSENISDKVSDNISEDVSKDQILQ